MSQSVTDVTDVLLDTQCPPGTNCPPRNTNQSVKTLEKMDGSGWSRKGSKRMSGSDGLERMRLDVVR